MRRVTTIGAAGAAVLMLIQLIPTSRTNPTITQDVTAAPAIESILRRSCYDCHSNETQWPWYADVAPVSWLVTRDVNRGRQHLNFSTWDKYSNDPETVIRKLRNIDKVMQSGTMPLWYYQPVHSMARLSDADRQMLEDWVMESIEAEDKRAGVQQ
jgi:hypothetical protein